MSRIVAGRFDNMTGAEAALSALSGQGFARSEFESFFVTPPGQHATYPVGGDAHSDEGARHAGGGALIGALYGGTIGLAVGFVLFMAVHQAIALLAGIGIGAYVGSLIGALTKTRSGDPRRATPEHPVEMPSGHIVAVRVDKPGAEPRAIQVLERLGAHDIERTEGEWENGDWRDFDPRLPAPEKRGVPTKSVASRITDAGQMEKNGGAR